MQIPAFRNKHQFKKITFLTPKRVTVQVQKSLHTKHFKNLTLNIYKRHTYSHFLRSSITTLSAHRCADTHLSTCRPAPWCTESKHHHAGMGLILVTSTSTPAAFKCPGKSSVVELLSCKTMAQTHALSPSPGVLACLLSNKSQWLREWSPKVRNPSGQYCQEGNPVTHTSVAEDDLRVWIPEPLWKILVNFLAPICIPLCIILFLFIFFLLFLSFSLSLSPLSPAPGNSVSGQMNIEWVRKKSLNIFSLKATLVLFLRLDFHTAVSRHRNGRFGTIQCFTPKNFKFRILVLLDFFFYLNT